ncbi:hypothetical protein WJX77_011580 [Trebouxia sp. C0004]
MSEALLLSPTTASSSALFPNSQQLEQPGTKAISSDQGFTLDKSAQAAASLASAWGLGSSYAFAEIAGPTVSLSDALSTLGMFSAVLVVLPGSRPPERPTNDTAKPFLTLQEGQYEGQLSNVLPISSINKAAASASAVLGQPLYPFRLEVLQFTKSSDHGPWVLYHVPTGSICLDKRVLENMKELPVTMASHMADFANQLFGHISGINVAAVQEASTGSYLGGIFSGAAAAASLAVASQIPLWFCITCPIVLGMLFPFAFNFGLGAIADELCTYYNLPADACTQLWYSAFALAMILSFASVLPIVTICRLAQCARNVSPRPG